MSQTVADLLDSFRRIDPAERPAAVAAILTDWTAGRTDQAVQVPAADGKLFGYVVPLMPQGEPPTLTAEEEAEFARRLADRHKARPLADLLRRLGLNRGAAGR